MTAAATAKVIVITDSKLTLDPVEIAVKRNNLELVRSYMNLFSLSIIRKQVASTKGLDFMGAEFFRFIREQGQPFAVILDGSINCGLGINEDPEGIMLFKKLLLSGMVIAHGKGYERYRGNYLLLARDRDLERLKGLTLNPKALLKTIESPEKTTAGIIDMYRKDIFRFGNRFYIECVRADSPDGELMSSVEKFITEIKNRASLTKLKSDGVPVDSTSTDPASIVYMGGNGAVLVDGEQNTVINKEYTGLAPGEFYIIGNWTSRTQMDVSKKLSRIILKGLSQDMVFEKDARIVINIDDRTRIDSSTAASIAGVLTKELNDYINIVFVTNKEKGFMLKNSPGFSLIQKRFRMKG